MDENYYPAETSANNVKAGELPYKTEITRVHSGSYAKNGHMFIVIRANRKSAKYSNALQVPFGLTPEQQKEVANALWEQLSLKYGL